VVLNIVLKGVEPQKVGEGREKSPKDAKGLRKSAKDAGGRNLQTMLTPNQESNQKHKETNLTHTISKQLFIKFFWVHGLCLAYYCKALFQDDEKTA
jgi:hypothetical protein